jgi:fructose-bisphosphate aldolase class I
MLALSTAKPLRAFALPPRNRRFRLTLSAQIPFASGVQARSGRRQVLVEALPSWQNIGLQEISMNITDLNKVALAMVAPGKGLLAADESSGTIKKRFDAIGVDSTPDSRRDYREMLFRSTEAMSRCISGVILYDETIWQEAKDGTPLVRLIEQAGVIPGIKVDEGTQPLPNCPGELITVGLDKLAERLRKYYERGARFAKWRAVIDIGAGIPSYAAVHTNSHALARYAALCQAAQIVPIVEPEVLMDGDHDIERCFGVTEFVLKEVFQQLYYQKVALEGMILKPNMVVPGKKSGRQVSVEAVAEQTVRLLKECVPSAVPGIAFLSGGQSDEDATAHLDAINRIGGLPWKVTFSYGRALQAAPQKAWSGRRENVGAGQQAFGHRARMNSLASKGEWTSDLEKKAA